MGTSRRVAELTKVLAPEYYTFYRGRKKKYIPKKHWVKNREELYKITSAIGEKIAKYIVEKEGGVIADGLGYFCIWMNPRKQTYVDLRATNYEKRRLNAHTEGYIYHPQLLAHIHPQSPLNFWTMERGFSRIITAKLAKELRSGKKYKFYYNIVRRVYSPRYMKKSNE